MKRASRLPSGIRVTAFAGLLAAIFALALVAGRATDPDAAADSGTARHDGRAPAASGGHGAADGGHGATPATPADAPAGLATSAGGLRLVATSTRFAAGRAQRLRFEIADERGSTVRGFELEQARRMHLVVVRRDLRRYQHLHPTQDAAGRWSVDLRLPDAGVYRAFADFRRGGARHTLGIDLFAAGELAPLALPPASETATVDGYAVRRHGHGPAELSFVVSRDGAQVEQLQPYLGARGHLVLLRAGDLAYQHVHPTGARRGEVSFDVGRPAAGSYRAFLQFRHGARVRTAAFTIDYR